MVSLCFRYYTYSCLHNIPEILKSYVKSNKKLTANLEFYADRRGLTATLWHIDWQFNDEYNIRTFSHQKNIFSVYNIIIKKKYLFSNSYCVLRVRERNFIYDKKN